MIDTPGHQKDIVDAINTCEKIYLKEKMCVIGTPENDDCKNRINNHVMIGEKTFSWEVACKILLEDNIRVNRIQSYKKLQQTSKIKTKDGNRTWYFQDMEDVHMI